MSPLRLTDHARRRMQQRGLRESDIERVLEVGRDYHQNGGVVVYLDARGRRWLRAGEDHLASVYLIVEPASGVILTVGHRSRNLRLH